MRATALLLLVAARAACRSLTGGDLPRYVNHPDRLPPGDGVLEANDALLGAVRVTVAGRNVTDNNVLRAAILSGLASATDWLSVDDVTAVATEAVGAATVPTESTPCGTSAPSLTYTIALVPAVLPTAAQARQLIDGAAKSVGEQFSLARLKDLRVAAADVRLDDKLYAARPAPFPVAAQAGSDNVLTGWLRTIGFGMDLCDAGLAAARNLRRRYLVDWLKQTADPKFGLVQDRPPGRVNVASTRFVRVLPQKIDSGTVRSFDPKLLETYLKGAVVDGLDMQLAVAGLTREQAAIDIFNITRFAPELARFLEPTPGLSPASVEITDDHWFYNGRDLAPKISSAALAAAICVPTLIFIALAAGGGIFITRRRRRARESAARVTALAAKGLGQGAACGSAGSSGKPSDILRAVRDAAPADSDPLARLAAVQWEINHADLIVSTGDDGSEIVLGEGAYGLVVRGRYAEQDVAIKILTTRDDGGRGLEDLAKEIVMLRACRHRNIVSFVGASIRDGVPPILVVELMPRGDLYRALENPKFSSVFSWRRAMDNVGRPRRFTGMNRRVALDIARGLSYLHSLGIMHLDVKSVNILLNSDFTAKLADVGAARALGDKASATLTSPVGTMNWMAPEIFLGDGRATDKADLFSFGVVLWELSTGEQPRRPLRHLTDDEAPAPIRALIDACLATDPAERPTAADVVAALEAIDDDGNPVQAPRSSSATIDSTLAKVGVRNPSGDSGGQS